MVYICKPCAAWVGVHTGTDKAKGRLANREFRSWKIEAHAAFDPIWKFKLGQGEPKNLVRNKTYYWLADELHLARSQTHIAFLDVELCKKVFELCNQPNQHLKHLPVSEPIPTGGKDRRNGPSGASEILYYNFDQNWHPSFKDRFG